MSWIHRLNETYEKCNGRPQFERAPLNPIATQYQDTQIVVTVDEAGTFRRAELQPLRDTLIPVSEDSASRSGSDPKANPLVDKLRYCAPDLARFGGDNKRYGAYEKQLREWCESNFSDPKATSVLRYLEKETLVEDLLRSKVLVLNVDKLSRLKVDNKQSIAAEDAWVRWRVESEGVNEADTWKDLDLFGRWAEFEGSRGHENGICMVGGETGRLTRLHPRGIRSNSDRAKLISANDDKDYTFRGKFLDGGHAASVGYQVSQQAHSALRWLIKRQQGTGLSGGQIFVAWESGGKYVPSPSASTLEWLDLESESGSVSGLEYDGDAGQLFALRLRDKILGYRADLGDASTILILGIDTATDDTGRLAVTYYRELSGSEFMDRIERWHSKGAWHQPIQSKGAGIRQARHRWIGVPSPRSIAEAAYGALVRGKDGYKQLRQTVERLIPCIVEERAVPRDLIEACIRRASNRVAFKKKGSAEWEACLSTACSLVRSIGERENYRMSLEEDRQSRDYLFGRLLAIGESIEELALKVADEDRDTNAARLMHRFANHPLSTWMTIWQSLPPYRARLRAKMRGALIRREKLLDQVMGKFSASDFTREGKLSGEFLLGYYCQRAALWTRADADEESLPEEEAIHDSMTEGETNGQAGE